MSAMVTAWWRPLRRAFASVSAPVVIPRLCDRVQDLRLDPVLVSVPDKVAALAEWAASVGLGMAEVAFLGDDYPDLPLFGAVGLMIAPPMPIPACCAARIG